MESIVRDKLIKASDEEYRKFSSKLLPDNKNILGVRLPELRKIAKVIAQGDWRYYLKSPESFYFEEVMLHGMVIGYVKTDIDEILNYIDKFIPLIDNWSVCDSFCSGLKVTKSNREKMFMFLQKYISSENEFGVRFAVCMLLNYYIDSQYIKRVLELLGKVGHEGYYAKMAVAWALSICFIKQREITMSFIESCQLDKFVYNKTLQKITESHAVDMETKKVIRSMKIED